MSNISSHMMEIKCIYMNNAEIYNERKIVQLFTVPGVGC
jgi:hypothetical protein